MIKKPAVVYTKEHIIESYREGLIDGMAKGERVSSDILSLYKRINIIRRALKEHGYILPNNQLSKKGEESQLFTAIFNAIDLEDPDD
ncbi:hypothetical protein N8457_00270 [bacterium]|nr:hypothetical protein [bacterium]